MGRKVETRSTPVNYARPRPGDPGPCGVPYGDPGPPPRSGAARARRRRAAPPVPRSRRSLPVLLEAAATALTYAAMALGVVLVSAWLSRCQRRRRVAGRPLRRGRGLRVDRPGCGGVGGPLPHGPRRLGRPGGRGTRWRSVVVRRGRSPPVGDLSSLRTLAGRTVRPKGPRARMCRVGARAPTPRVRVFGHAPRSATPPGGARSPDRAGGHGTDGTTDTEAKNSSTSSGGTASSPTRANRRS